MRRIPKTAAGLRLVQVALAAVLLAAALGGGCSEKDSPATPLPTPTAEPTPTPFPTPAAVAMRPRWSTDLGAPDTDEYPGDAVEVPGVGYVACGTRWPMGQTEGGSWVTWMVDLGGNPVWERDDGPGFCWTAAATRDGGALLGGYRGESSRVGTVVKINSAGQTVWERSYPWSTNVPAVTAVGDGFAIIAFSNSGAVLYRLDSAGTALWQQSLSAGGDFLVAQSLDARPQGGFVVGGLGVPGAEPQTPYVARLDSRGLERWGRYLPAEGFDLGFGVRVTATDDGGAAARAYYWRRADEAQHFALARLDREGALLWQRSYPDAGLLYDVTSGGGGGLVVSGVDPSFLMKVDASGDVVWQRGPGNDGGVGVRVSVASDEGFLVCGYRYPTWPASSQFDVVLVKTDSIGNH